MLTCEEAIERRIETTKLTGSETFSELDKYIKAASVILDPDHKCDPSKVVFVLSLQLLAKKLIQVVPQFLEEIAEEVDESIGID